MKREILFRVVAIAAAVVFAMGVGEIAARILKPHSMYFPRADLSKSEWIEYHGLTLWNERRDRGMEDQAVAATRREDAFRIVGLGDSIMFGSGVELPDSYIGRLEDELEKITGKETAVVDMAQPGYGLKHEAAIFDYAGVRAKPDLVIVHAWEDDATDYIVVGKTVYHAEVYTDTGVIRTIPLPHIANEFLILNSRLYQYLSLLALGKRLEPDNNDRRRADCITALDSIYANSRESSARILIVLSPLLTEKEIGAPDKDKPPQYYYDIVSEWAAGRTDVEILDLRDKLRGVRGSDIGLDQCHFNVKGHNMVLEILANHIAAEYMN